MMEEVVELSDIVVAATSDPTVVYGGQQKRPRGVATMPNNDIVLAEGRRRNVEIISDSGEMINEITFKALNKTCDPYDVAIGRDREIFVTDQGNNRVYTCLEGGNLLRVFGSDELHKPAGVAVTNDNRVLVADSERACVRIYNYDGSYVKSFGRKGYALGDFFTPQFIAVNSRNQFLVTDYRHDSLQIFDDNCTFIHCIKGLEDADVWRPMGVTTDNEDNIYVCDAFTYKIRKFGPDFKFIGVVDSAEGTLMGPHGLAMMHGECNKLVVADCGNNSVKLFKV